VSRPPFVVVPESWINRRWVWVVLLLAAVVPHLNGLDGGFHYDDEHALVRNTHLRHLSEIPRFFVDSSTFSSEPDMAMYRPLLQTTFALNHGLAGYNPWSWHVVNVLIHGLAVFGAFALLRKVLHPHVALGAALLYALHPAHSQAINYLSSRSETLCIALVLWALALLQSKRAGWSVLLYAGALLTKSAAVVFLPVAALLYWVRPGHRRHWQQLLPHGVTTAIYLILISAEGFLPRSLSQDVRPMATQLWTQCKGIVYYLSLAVVPHGLSIEHDFVASAEFWDPPVLLSASLALSLLWLNRGAWKTRLPVLGLGALWFLSALGLPFLMPLNVIINEHRLYLPLLGFAIVVGTALPSLQRAHTALLVLMCVIFCGLSISQNRLWQNELQLWGTATKRAPNSFRSWSNLALAQHTWGDRKSALVSYEKALKLNPGHARAWNNLGLLREESGQLVAARDAYVRAAEQSPSFSGPLANLGRLALETGDLQTADRVLPLALQRNDRDVEARLHQGRLLQILGKRDSAQAYFEQVLVLDPVSAAAANNLGLLYAERGELVSARHWLQRAVDSEPGDSEAAANLMLMELESEGVERRQAYEQVWERFPERLEVGKALADLHARAHEWSAAEAAYRTVAEGNRFVAGLQAALGEASKASGNMAQALTSFRLAVQESDQDVRLWNSLAAAAAALGELEEAQKATGHALEIDPDNAVARANLRRLERP
jgi:Flp pilus assembly protein TadD